MLNSMYKVYDTLPHGQSAEVVHIPDICFIFVLRVYVAAVVIYILLCNIYFPDVLFCASVWRLLLSAAPCANSIFY